MGDSRTSSPPNTWPVTLAASLNAARGQKPLWLISNVGVSGSSVASTLAALTTLKGQVNAACPYPDQVGVVLMNFGVNDAIISPENPAQKATWIANYESIIDSMKTSYPNAQVYIMKPWTATFPASPIVASWIDQIVADRSSFVHLGPDEAIWLKGGDNGATNTTDGVHYSTAGNAAAVMAWQPIIQP